MKIKLASIFVDNQDKALQFYTEKLGFIKKQDASMGEYRWLTVVSPDNEDFELLLEPNGHPASKAYQAAIYKDGIPATALFSSDLMKECEELKKKGVQFKIEPTTEAWGSYAVFDDTCGNWINVAEVK
ncbi:MAG TPA: VOC family protein [Ignavibacteriaceae bacterium]|nr:VOC family protein [Ignavibacteriaceae bacterium]